MPRGVMTDLPRRRCDNCAALYKLKQRLPEGQHGFCSANCRKEFHKHGGSFSKLKPVVVAEVKKRIKELSPADQFRMEAMEKRITELEQVIQKLRQSFQ